MKKVLIECFANLLENCEHFNEVGTDYNEDEIIGIAAFVKEVAFRADNVELLGLATKLEMICAQKKDAEKEVCDQWEEMQQQEVEQSYGFYREAKKICSKAFFKSNKLSVDMGKYRDLLEENEPLLTEWGGYERLHRYIDEENVLMKVYQSVKSAMAARTLLPTEEDVLIEYRFQVTEIYRKADMYLASQLAKAKAELGKA